MGLGTGIFLASIVLGLVLLYGQTKDRWRWKKIVLRTLLGIFALASATALFFWTYSKYENRVIAQTEFLSISLDDKAADVKFKKGNPAADDGRVWIFRNSENMQEHVVIFKDSTIKAVLYVGDCTYCNNIFGLGIGTSYVEVKEKLGEPTSVSVSSDQLGRIASFEKWNLVFDLKENKVIAFGIYNPKLGPLIFSKEVGDESSKPVLKRDSTQ
jgi:hypothetical protein